MPQVGCGCTGRSGTAAGRHLCSGGQGLFTAWARWRPDTPAPFDRCLCLRAGLAARATRAIIAPVERRGDQGHQPHIPGLADLAQATAGEGRSGRKDCQALAGLAADLARQMGSFRR